VSGVLIIGVAFVVAGVLGVVFRDRIDSANMKLTPKSFKPPDGGGVFDPDQRPFRIRGQVFASVGFAVSGAVVIVIALVHR
jgi:hypothetical protein